MGDNFGYGQQEPGDGASQFNAVSFVIDQALARVRTVTLVKVTKVTAGAEGGQSIVDCQPMVNQLDGNNNSSPLAVIFSLPVYRLQAGGNAIIIDPVVGDIGIALISDRDISAVISAKAQGNPGSLRKFDLADSIYMGGVLNGACTQFVKFTANDITIQDKNGNKIEMTSTGIKLTGVVHATGAIVAGFGGVDQVSLQTHTHPGNNLPPTPGT